jgi:hypothetical protein
MGNCAVFRQSLLEAKEYQDERFAAFLAAADCLAAKMSPEEQAAAVSGALACGLAVACEIAGSFKGRPAKLAEQMGLRIVEAPRVFMRPILSSYDPAARIIAVNPTLLNTINRIVDEYGIAELLGEFDPQEVAIGHELFHHVEGDGKNLFVKRFSITLWRIGSFHYRSTIPAVSEIAAFACAKALCRLDFNPLLLDAIILKGTHPEQVEPWFRRLRETS